MTRVLTNEQAKTQAEGRRIAALRNLGYRYAVAIGSLRGTSPEGILSHLRGAKRDPARQEVMWLLRNVEALPWWDVAEATRRESHWPAMNGARRVEQRIAERPELRDELLAVAAGIEARTERRAA